MNQASASRKSSFKLGYSLLKIGNLVFRFANRILRVGTRVLQEAPDQNAVSAFWAACKTYRVEHQVRAASPDTLVATNNGKPETPSESARRAREIWIDVGAHLGEQTFEYAEQNPDLVVYAFEPSVALVAQRAGQLPNFIVIPMAVSEQEGFRKFYLNSDDTTNSLLPINLDGQDQWLGGEAVTTVGASWVPTIRLDTFLNQMAIDHVDYLKIDAQGHDLEVVRSLGERIKDIKKVKLEATISAVPQYKGSNNNLTEVMSFMEGQGFVLDASDGQTYGQEMNLTFRRESAAAGAPVEVLSANGARG